MGSAAPPEGAGTGAATLDRAAATGRFRHEALLYRDDDEFLGAAMPSGEHLAKILAYIEPGSYKPFADFFPEPPPFVPRSAVQAPRTQPGSTGREDSAE